MRQLRALAGAKLGTALTSAAPRHPAQHGLSAPARDGDRDVEPDKAEEAEAAAAPKRARKKS
jgi:hypothetical protein